ncbi:MAG TPA: PP2C family serine/threonine-protein phosphatase [Acidobacteriaceae bacterium]|jgi:protein phosphatase
MNQHRKEFVPQQHGFQSTSKATTMMTDLLMDVAGLSDIGDRRSNNEDCFGYDLETNIFVVCDGMGGLAAGEVASSTAVELTLRTYKELYHQEMDPEKRLHSAIANANQTVWNMAQQDRNLRGMGTTLVAACVLRNRLLIGNVGDSRAYFLRDGDCVQITEDHSYAAEQMRRGGTGVSARLKQFITRAVGVDAAVKPDFFVVDLEPGDIVLLTTDGLTRYADAEKLAHQIYTHSDLEEICRRLIAIAHEGGAEDNVTCLLLRVR